MTEAPDHTRDGAGARDTRRLLIGVGVAVVLAVLGGAAFGLVPLTLVEADEEPTERTTERSLVTIPEPEGEPAPVEVHFPAISGLESSEADDELTRGLESALAPEEDGGYADTHHVQLTDDDGGAVAVISLLRAEDDEAGRELRTRALDGLTELFETLEAAEVGDEELVLAESMAGSALLWVPDGDSVVLVTAVDGDRAELVMAEVVAAVNGDGPAA